MNLIKEFELFFSKSSQLGKDKCIKPWVFINDLIGSKGFRVYLFLSNEMIESQIIVKLSFFKKKKNC